MNTSQAIDLITAKARELCSTWEVDDDNREVVTTAAAWLAREPRQGMDLNKGLLIVGNVGTGKTLLLRAVRNAMRDAHGTQFGIRSCSELVRSFTDGGYDDIDAWMTAPHVCFDDLGTEGEAVHYGKRTNLMAEVIEARYERLSAGRKCWTHITTNLGTDGIESKYGPRAASRLRHMCNLLDLGASSAARDRRAGAAGIRPPSEPVNADNVYSIVHPEVAARLRLAIAPAVEAAQAITAHVQRQRIPSPTMADDLASFAAGLEDTPTDELTTGRARIAAADNQVAAAPYLQAIDQELKAREEANPQTAVA